MNDTTTTATLTPAQERNMAQCRRVLAQVWQGGELDICHEVFTKDFVRHDANSGDSIGPDGYIELVAKLRQAFPDLTVEIEKLAPVDNIVFFRTTMHATHTGSFYGIPPTGTTIETKTHAEVHFDEEGMSIEAWVISDYFSVTKSIVNAMSLWQKLTNLPTLLRLLKK